MQAPILECYWTTFKPVQWKGSTVVASGCPLPAPSMKDAPAKFLIWLHYGVLGLDEDLALTDATAHVRKKSDGRATQCKLLKSEAQGK